MTKQVDRLDKITRRLRRECPWDREQDERSIVPHTVEEAYELADAARAGDDAKLLDELGDVLFQVHFLALLLEERGAGSLDEVAGAISAKLIRRHPHVFGDADAETAGAVLRQWDSIKREERGGELFGELPETLPSTLYARKLLVRAARAGRGEPHAGEALGAVQRLCEEFQAGEWADEDAFDRIGDVLLSAVDAARALGEDPELALRAAAQRFRDENEQTDR